MPFKAFKAVYQKITGAAIKEPVNPTDKKIVDFVLSTKFVTPAILIEWNKDNNLKLNLPFKMWIEYTEENTAVTPQQ